MGQFLTTVDLREARAELSRQNAERHQATLIAADAAPMSASRERRHSAPRLGRSFTAAQASRIANDWFASIQSADQEIRWNLRALRARSRQLARNNGYAKRFFTLVKNNIIGPKGINLQGTI